MTKPCSCGKKMIRVSSGVVLTSYPPQYPMDWWCACGRIENAGVEIGMTAEDLRKKEWESAQESTLSPDPEKG